MKSLVSAVLLLVLAYSHSAIAKNQQAWSHHVYLNEAYNLSCHDTNITLTRYDELSWTRHPSNKRLAGGHVFRFYPSDGVNNAILHIVKVTDKLGGFYLCHVNGTVKIVLQAINLEPNERYHDKMDRYRTDIIRGIIAAASVAFLVISIGLINQYRYLTEDQLVKRQERKEKSPRQTDGNANLGYENKPFYENTGI